MEFRIALPAQADFSQLSAALEERDPAAVVDTDPASGKLRVSTWITACELTEALGSVGITLSAADIEQLQSNCCGGCGG